MEILHKHQVIKNRERREQGGEVVVQPFEGLLAQLDLHGGAEPTPALADRLARATMGPVFLTVSNPRSWPNPNASTLTRRRMGLSAGPPSRKPTRFRRS